MALKKTEQHWSWKQAVAYIGFDVTDAPLDYWENWVSEFSRQTKQPPQTIRDQAAAAISELVAEMRSGSIEAIWPALTAWREQNIGDDDELPGNLERRLRDAWDGIVNMGSNDPTLSDLRFMAVDIRAAWPAGNEVTIDIARAADEKLLNTSSPINPTPAMVDAFKKWALEQGGTSRDGAIEYGRKNRIGATAMKRLYKCLPPESQRGDQRGKRGPGKKTG